MVLVDELKKPNIILASISYGRMKEKPPLRLANEKVTVTTSTLTMISIFLIILISLLQSLYYLSVWFNSSFLLEF